MRSIPLTQGQVTEVDDDQYEALNQWKWQAQWMVCTKSFYAVRRAKTTNGRWRLILMHREIVGAPDGVQVDHENHDTLDNKRENLRLATYAQNGWNRGIQKNNTSGFKGVTLFKSTGRWVFKIRIGGGKRIQGYRDTALEASQEYNRLAKIYHGEFARAS